MKGFCADFIGVKIKTAYAVKNNGRREKNEEKMYGVSGYCIGNHGDRRVREWAGVGRPIFERKTGGEG
jgi:hypothetical protein